MIKFFLRKSYILSISVLFFLLVVTCFSLYLLKNNDHSFPVFLGRDAASILPRASLLKSGIHFRVAQDPMGFQESAPLLLRCLFPSDALITSFNVDDRIRAEIASLIFPPNLKPLLPEEVERFRQEMQVNAEMQSIGQAWSGPLKNIQIPERPKFLLSDDLDFRGVVKPGGKPILNVHYPNYCFPVAWPFYFRNDFGDPRGPHRLHMGIDIAAEEGTEVYAITDGVIHQLADWPRAGNTILLRGRDGRGYIYMHLQRFAEGITEGRAVRKGELIAYVGHTGTFSSGPHLHFQIHEQGFSRECATNPYEPLVSLCQGRGVTDLGQPMPQFSRARGPDLRISGGNVYASKKPLRRELFVVMDKPVAVKTALIKTWEGTLPAHAQTGLNWRVPKPTWKVSQASLLVPDPKEETPPEATRVTWTLRKPKSSSLFLTPTKQ